MDSQMHDTNETIRIAPSEMEAEFRKILISHEFTEQKASLCAAVFTENSIDGVYTHGVNRFPKFVEYVEKKYILINEGITHVSGFGNVEQWNGNLGPGPINALDATDRVMEISRKYGMGCVALKNTNHWMRGGYYGWKAAKSGFIFIGWSNTIANMPAWGATDSKLGNNPMVIAVPFKDEAIVLDMAMSQYSYGALELHQLRDQLLAVNGGYDMKGELTTDPGDILQSRRVLPVGYWKGAGLSLLLDIVGTILTAGNATYEITRNGPESAVSQVFIAIDVSKLINYPGVSLVISQIIDDYHHSVPQHQDGKITYPGERVLLTRKENLEKGIPVSRAVWEHVKSL